MDYEGKWGGGGPGHSWALKWLEIIAKLNFVYFCHHKCIIKSSVLVNVYYCYSVTKPLHKVEKIFAEDCGVCTVGVLNMY
jgi:hypothetical protein